MLKITRVKNSLVLASQLRSLSCHPLSGGSSLCKSLPGGHFLDLGSEVNHRDINCKVAQSHDSELARIRPEQSCPDRLCTVGYGKIDKRLFMRIDQKTSTPSMFVSDFERVA